jgi:hypothetical protein
MKPITSNGAAPPAAGVWACGRIVMLAASATITAAVRPYLERIALVSFTCLTTVALTAGTA